MDRPSMATVVFVGLVLATSLCRGGAESINCDSVYFAELGKPYIIACNVTGDQYYVYWFKGGDTSTLPILSFDDQGEKSLHKEYSFTDNKSLNITYTELKHEGKYTLRVYFNRFDFDTATTELQVYILPDPPCPLIDACSSTCTGCQLNVTTSGSLTCYVNGSRPIMDVDWIVTNQSGVSFTKEEQTHKEMGDRWYTEKTIEYTTPDCGADATFRCIASLSDVSLAPLLDTHYSTVRIDKEACKEPPSMEPTSSPKGQVAWPFVVIGIIIVFVVICAIFIAFCLYRRRGKDTTKETTPDQNTEMQTKRTKQKPKKKSLEEMKNTLVEGLMKYYEKFCFIKPLPWGEPIPIHALYTTCQCTITNVKGDVTHHASDFLSTPEFNFDSNRVFIIADLGYGKTTYTQHLVSDWVSKMKPTIGKETKISEPILIYIHLKEVDPSMILSDLVKKMMPVGIDLKVDDIVEIFLNFEFQVLLDGLDELSMSTIGVKTSPENSTNDKEERVKLIQKEGENDSKLTVENLLDNQINTFKFKKLKVWVTSREVDDMKDLFALPYSKVNLNGLSDPQVNEYIRKTCKYYFKSQAIPQLTLIPEVRMKDSKLDASQQAKSDVKIQETIETKTASNDSRPLAEGGCNNAENVKFENPMNREKNDYNINEVNEESNQTMDDREQNKLEQTQTADVEQRQNEKIIDEQIGSNKSFAEDAKNKVNESNMIAGDESDEVTTKLIPAAHHEIKQGESEQKGSTVPGNDVQTTVACDTLEILSKNVTECMELNEISHNFSETPLLLIMIIHIITCKMLDPTGKYKEVNVNKLTTIIRLVITCLESRYVQKVNKKTIQEDIKNLEAELGKIAFENKMSLSLGKREYWNSTLGKEDTQLALAVGLLKYSKKVGSGGSQLEELAFSSYAGIMFYHDFFQEFLAAQYVPESDEEWAWIDEFIKKSTDDATVRLLQFMFGMNHARLDKAVQSLMKEQKMWNNLIDCIYEISNLEKKRTIIKGMDEEAGKLGGNMAIHMHHLDRKHHRVAVKDLCDACNASDVKLKRMTLREECAIDFIKDVTLPSLKFLIFLEMNVNEDQFVSIITSLTNKKCPEILQFVKCSVPDELKEEAKQTVESALKGLDMKIYNCEKTSPFTMRVPKFNPKKGTWGNELFPENI